VIDIEFVNGKTEFKCINYYSNPNSYRRKNCLTCRLMVSLIVSYRPLICRKNCLTCRLMVSLIVSYRPLICTRKWPVK